MNQWILTKEFKDYIIKSNLDTLEEIKIGLIVDPESETAEEKYIFPAVKQGDKYTATPVVDSSIEFNKIVILFKKPGEESLSVLGYSDTVVSLAGEESSVKIEFTFSLDDLAVKDILYKDDINNLVQEIVKIKSEYTTDVQPLYKALDHSDNNNDTYTYLVNVLPYYGKLLKLMDKFREFYLSNKYDEKLEDVSYEAKRVVLMRLQELTDLLCDGPSGFNALTFVLAYKMVGEPMTLELPDTIISDRPGYGRTSRVSDFNSLTTFLFLNNEINNKTLSTEEFKEVFGIEPDAELNDDSMNSYITLIEAYNLVNNKYKNRETRRKIERGYRSESGTNKVYQSFELTLQMMYNADITSIPIGDINVFDFLAKAFKYSKNSDAHKSLLAYAIKGSKLVDSISLLTSYENYVKLLNKNFYQKPKTGLYYRTYNDLSVVNPLENFLGEFIGKDIPTVSEMQIDEDDKLFRALMTFYLRGNKNSNFFKLKSFQKLQEFWKENSAKHLAELKQRFEEAKQDAEISRARTAVLEEVKNAVESNRLITENSNVYINYAELVKRAINKVFLNKTSDALQLGSVVENPYLFTYMATAEDMGLKDSPEYETTYKALEQEWKEFDIELHEYFFVYANLDKIAKEIGKTENDLKHSEGYNSYKIIFEMDSHDGNTDSGYGNVFDGLYDSFKEDGTRKFVRMWAKGWSRAGVITNYAGYDKFYGEIKYAPGGIINSYENNSEVFDLYNNFKLEQYINEE